MASGKGKISTDRPSPAFLLLAALCRRGFAGPDREARAVPDPIDWPLFLRLTRFHRVQGVVARGLQAGSDIRAIMPAPVLRELADDAAQIAAANLLMARESRALAASFSVAGIPILFVKGLTLGALAYGNIAVKAAVDIDLLVEADRLADSAVLLETLGYQRTQPAGSIGAGRLADWHAVRKESTWFKRDSGLQVDLHTRLADNDRLIPGVGIGSPRQDVRLLPDILLPTLGRDELFAYLCVHGASSAWFRLKWICDLAALVEHGGKPVERLYRNATRLGAGRTAAQALLLADRLFGTLDDAPGLRAELNEGQANRLLARIAFNQLAGTAEPREPTGRPFGTAAIHLSQLLLMSGPRFAATELWRQGRSALLRP